MLRYAEYIINEKRIKSNYYVGITSVDSFKAKNEFESTFTPVAAGGGTIKTRRNSAFNSNFFKGLNKTKENHAVSMYLPLSRLFRLRQDINRVFRGITHQIILKRNDFSNMIIKSGAQNLKVDAIHLSLMLPVLYPSLPIATH